MKNLMPISTKVYNLLIGEGIQEEEILEVMNNIQRDIAKHFEVKIDIEEQYFNLLQDIVWYNLERKEKRNITDIGRLYPSFMYLCDNGNEIPYEEINGLKNNLIDIKKKLNDSICYLVQLSGAEKLFEDKNSKVFYIDKRKNKKEEKEKRETNSITCVIQEDIKSYHMENIKINTVIDVLIGAIEKAEKNKSKIVINFI